MNSDNIKGKMKDIGGKAQRVAGEVTGDSELEAKGTANQVEGKVQNAWGNVKKEARDLKDDVKSKLEKNKDARDDRNDLETNRDEVA